MTARIKVWRVRQHYLAGPSGERFTYCGWRMSCGMCGELQRFPTYQLAITAAWAHCAGRRAVQAIHLNGVRL